MNKKKAIIIIIPFMLTIYSVFMLNFLSKIGKVVKPKIELYNKNQHGIMW